MILLFLTSGLFLGWSLGANDAANVFGTAVGTRMLRFRTAAVVASLFVMIGAVSGGGGTTETLGKLGAVSAPAGAFMVALAAAVTVFLMTRLKLPVSCSQAIVGAIIGWNFFSGVATDRSIVTKIVSTWILCPLLAALMAMILYYLFRFFVSKTKINLLKEDYYVRLGLLIVGAFGSYSLGANNIANVIGVFVPSMPLKDVTLFGSITFNGAQQLFVLGGLAITVGIFSYSGKVMETIGNGILRLSPMTALIVVLAQAIVLFLFSSESLESWLVSHHLPAIPLVPVSSSQAVVGAVLGIGLVRGGRDIRYRVLGGISSGWVTTPIIAGLLSFTSLFFLQNVFMQDVCLKPESSYCFSGTDHYSFVKTREVGLSENACSIFISKPEKINRPANNFENSDFFCVSVANEDQRSILFRSDTYDKKTFDFEVYKELNTKLIMKHQWKTRCL